MGIFMRLAVLLVSAWVPFALWAGGMNDGGAARSTPAATASSAPTMLPQAAIARRYFGNDAPWYENNIPFFDSPDAKTNQIYYYRWEVFRAHIRAVGAQGNLFTEFLQDMTWDRDPYSTLNDSAIFPIYDGR